MSSITTPAQDRGTKRKLYLEAGVEEYWPDKVLLVGNGHPIHRTGRENRFHAKRTRPLGSGIVRPISRAVAIHSSMTTSTFSSARP